jgi:hypothetical protein
LLDHMDENTDDELHFRDMVFAEIEENDGALQGHELPQTAGSDGTEDVRNVASAYLLRGFDNRTSLLTVLIIEERRLLFDRRADEMYDMTPR